MDAVVDISRTTLETERLILRPWRQRDLEDFYEYASVDGVGQMAGWIPHRSKEESQEILKLFIEEKKTFALEEKASGKVIGSLGLESAQRQETKEDLQNRWGREVDYVLSKDYWGKGLMPEAVKRVIQYAFDEEGWDFLLCGHFLENHQSRRVIEKSGFHYYRDIVFPTRWGEDKLGKLYLLERKK